MLAVEQLGELADEMVFLGGCATGLLITDPAAPPIRITRDVDAIVQVISLADYHHMSDRLRACGFQEDSSSDVICRWLSENVILDIMPTDPQILRFGNKWYEPAMMHAERVQLPSGKNIRMVSAAYLLVTKLEAFAGRGGGDYLLSHDIEDIVAVLDGRPGIVEEVKQSDPELSSELSDRFRNLLKDNRFTEAVAGHMPADASSQARVAIVLDVMKAIAKQ